MTRAPKDSKTGRRVSRWPSLAAVLVLTAAVSAPSAARADTFDLALPRLVLPPGPNGYADPGSDANVQAGALTAYRQVMSELSVALAPKWLTPADTVGFSGYHLSVDYSFTTISNQSCDAATGPLTKGACPWQYAVEGNGGKLPGMIHTLSVMARKGIWLPLPSFEIGAGATKVLQSSLFAVQVYAKFALHEGFHKWPLPSIAARGSVVRLVGESQIDLTMVQVDGEISKSFGIAGSVTLVPYFGFAWLYSLPRGQVLDLTPEHDAYKDGPNSLDLNNNAVFPASANANITRWRFGGGFRLNYSILVISAEFIGSMCGDFNGKCDGSGHPKDGKTVPDNAATQYTFAASAGFLF